MPSQTDLDQGGTFRTRTRVWMGPSIGWVEAPNAILRVTSGGTTVVQQGVGIVTVNFNGAVTIQLPVFKGSVAAGAIGQPGPYVNDTVTIIDTGGFATANNITILPGAGETIDGQPSYPISSNFGAVVLQPDPINGGSSVVT